MKFKINHTFIIFILASIISIMATVFYYNEGTIMAFGDAAQHVNIAKRVVHGLTPGFGQLGSVWLPLQHLMIIPFILDNFLWTTGLGGSIVSMICYILIAVLIFKIIEYVSQSKLGGYIGAIIFLLNPNSLYMQSTAMGEMPLLLFLTGSGYFFIKWVYEDKIHDLIFAALLGSAGTLIRYDAWFLVVFESLFIFAKAKYKQISFSKIEGALIMHGVLAYSGILFWLMWNLVIFGSPIHFTTSQYSARHQQMSWLAKGMLPTYLNPILSTFYYLAAVVQNVGIIIVVIGVISLIYYFVKSAKDKSLKYFFVLILFVPFPFYVFSLLIGNAVIFVPGITPESFQGGMFNVRYGLMMLPALAVIIGLISYQRKIILFFIIFLVTIQYILMFQTGDVIAHKEGTTGIASRYIAGINPAEAWFRENYDEGLVLLNSYFGAVEIHNLNIPMDQIIYEGSYKYWQESLIEPQKYAKWIILKKDKDDPLWQAFQKNKYLPKHFKEVYKKDIVVIYKRNY